jgi:hypothetical protein
MMDGFQGLEQMLTFRSFRLSQPLSGEQKSQVQAILSRYDASKVCVDDASEIFRSFRESGINPGPGLREAIKQAGFDDRELRALAKTRSQRPSGMVRWGMRINALR